jgi:putative ABC transport system substrate-binding protein
MSEMTLAGTPVWRAFFDELRRLGYVEGQNLVVDRRSAEGDPERLGACPALAREQSAGDLHNGHQGRSRAQGRDDRFPIVAATPDPVRAGLVASLARPGGNITGFSIDAGLGIIGKRIELLKQAAPNVSRMAVLAPQQAGESRFPMVFAEAAQRAGVALVAAGLEPPIAEATYQRAFAVMREERVDSLYVGANTENYAHRRRIAELAAEARLPSVHPFRESAEAGGLMAYAFDITDIWRSAAGYVDRILKGANPAELPFQQPSKFELVINLKTAKALGLAMPPTLLARADEVIE